MRKKQVVLVAIMCVIVSVLFSARVNAVSLGIAQKFNTFIFGDYACTSDAEGRVAVGGNMTVSGYSVADKLTSEEIDAYPDTLIVGGDLVFSAGRVYYGNIRVGGSADGVSAGVISGMAPGAEFIVGEALPIDFASEKLYLRNLSTNLAQKTSTGTVTNEWGQLILSGDNTSALQVFNVEGDETLKIWGLTLTNIPEGAQVVINISGATAGFQNMNMETLSQRQNNVLFNCYEATTLQLASVAVRGSILAPLARVENPSGVIWGTIIAASWNGPMQQNHVPFDEEDDSEEPEPTQPIAVPSVIPEPDQPVIPPAVPEPTTILLFGLGLGGLLGWKRVFRKK